MRGRHGTLKVAWATALALVLCWGSLGLAEQPQSPARSPAPVTPETTSPSDGPRSDAPAIDEPEGETFAAEAEAEAETKGEPGEERLLPVEKEEPTGEPASPASVCESEHERAQVERLAGRLTAAKQSLVACARETCPSFFRSDCARWLDEVRAEVPTVVFEALEPGGALVDVSVTVDGLVVAERLDGRPIEFDPGLMEATFTRPSGESQVVRVVLRQGEKNRVLSVTFAPEATTTAVVEAREQEQERDPRAQSFRPVPTAVYVLGGVAAAATLSMTTFGILAKVREADAKDECAPQCTDSVVGQVQGLALAADISLGVALATGATALVLYLTRPSARLAGLSPLSLAADASPARARSAVVVIPEGAVLSVEGSF